MRIDIEAMRARARQGQMSSWMETAELAHDVEMLLGEVERLRRRLDEMSDDVTVDEAGMTTCEHCDRAFPFEEAISSGDGCHFCPSCWAEWKAEFDACAHDWEAAADDNGDVGRVCLRCSGFVSDDMFDQVIRAALPSVETKEKG